MCCNVQEYWVEASLQEDGPIPEYEAGITHYSSVLGLFSPSPYPKDTGWDRESQLCVYVGVCVSAVISSSSSSPSSLEEGSSQTYVGAVLRDLSLYVHSVLFYSLCGEMFPREYLPTQG